jgi:oxepin-CoA hydrolase/3-oxo-5,6-dehydrosuberyl-CoA semialdehyde dehydrogenase
VFGEKLAAQAGNRTFLTDGDMLQLTRSTRFVGQHLHFTRPGVAVHINAFNFPAWGTFEKLAVAFLAGVPVITKPATATALVTYKMVKLMVESGKVPEGSVQLIVGSTGDLLDRLGPMDSLAFTGSANTGLMLRSNQNLLRNSVRVNVEADSLNALVLAPDVTPGSDLWNSAVRAASTDMTQKTGQKCTAIRRILVPADHADALEEQLVDALSSVVVGDPTGDATMGPVATASQLRDVLAGIAELATEAKVVLGGGRVDGHGVEAGKGYFVAPTVLRSETGAKPGKVHDIEVFGPCTNLLPYDGSAGAAACILSMGQGSLVSTACSDDRSWIETFSLGATPWLGRLMLLGTKIADQATPPGMVLPSLIHGGPGRAGGGEELGGERGLLHYMQRTAIQGDQVVLKKLFLGEGSAS